MLLKPDRHDKIFTGTMLLVHALFFVLACFYKRIYMGDSFEYIYEALNIKQLFFFYSGNPALPIAPEYMTQRQPGYPLFLLGVYLFVVNNWVVLICQNLLSLFNVWYTRKMLLSIGYQKKYDWLLLVLLIAYPAQFINANTIAPDILLQTFTLLYFGTFIGLLQKKQLKYAIWMSLSLTAGLFVKPVLYPFVLVHFLIVLITCINLRVKMQRFVLAALAPVCAMLLYSYSNSLRTGKFHFSSNQAFNAVYYYYPFLSATHGADSAARFLAAERRNIEALPEFKDRYDYANDLGTTMLEHNFMPYLWFHLKHSLRIFIEPGKAEIDLFTGKLTYGRLYSKEQTGFYATLKTKGWAGMSEYVTRNPSLLIALLILICNIVRLAGLALFLSSKAVPTPIRLFAFILLTYFAIAAGPIANTRYFLPVSSIAIGCSVIGIGNRSARRLANPNNVNV
jgi:hypothetical protein